jgi:hypothetical protein
MIVTRTCSRLRTAARRNFAGVIAAQAVGRVVVNRTGVGHLLGNNTEFVQFLDDLVRLYFQLPRQLIDSNLTHSQEIYLPALPLVTAC